MAFPTTSVLDDFNIADGSPSSNWSGFAGFSLFTISSNRLCFDDSGFFALHKGYWNAAQFGPDCEMYLSFGSIPNTRELDFAWRVNDPTGAFTWDGYMCIWMFGATNGDTRIYRVDNQAGTQLGATLSVTIAANDTVGIEMIGSTITAYRKASGGSWASLDTRSDSTYTGAGYLSLGGDAWTNETYDNFGGGTVVTATVNPPIPNVVDFAVARSSSY